MEVRWKSLWCVAVYVIKKCKSAQSYKRGRPCITIVNRANVRIGMENKIKVNQ